VVRKADLIISVGYHPTETFEPQNFNPRGKIRVVHLVLVDQKLGLIENHQRRNALTPSGVKVPQLNIKSLAKGMGARGHMVKRIRGIRYPARDPR